MPRRPPEMKLSPEEIHELQKLANGRTTAQQIVTRAKILLALHQGEKLTHYAKQAGLSTRTVKMWRNRWLATTETGLSAVERMRDEPRSGPKPKFSAEQYCQLMAIGLEDPKASGREISHWTARDIKEEAVKRGIVENIGLTSIREFFKRERLQTTQKPVLAQSKTQSRTRT
jgi:putative transposase